MNREMKSEVRNSKFESSGMKSGDHLFHPSLFTIQTINQEIQR